jgi:hypothetical protein
MSNIENSFAFSQLFLIFLGGGGEVKALFIL